MKALNSNLILRHFFAIVLVTTGGACSFKKDPEKDKKQVVMVKQLDALNEEPDNLMNSISEDEFLAQLEGKSASTLENIKTTKGESLLDIAIRLKKTKILSFLLEKEFNPFLYSQATYESLELNSKYKEMIRTFQTPVLYRLADKMHEFIKNGDVDTRLQILHLQSHACLSLINVILDWRHYRNGYEAGDYMTDDHSTIDPVIGIKTILSSKSCMNVRDKVPSTQLSKWVAGEVVFQRYKGFKSIELLKLLLELGDVEAIAIDGYENGHKLRICPLAVFESTNRDLSPELEKQWTETLTKIRSSDLEYYHLTSSSWRYEERINALFDRGFGLYDPDWNEEDGK